MCNLPVTRPSIALATAAVCLLSTLAVAQEGQEVARRAEEVSVLFGAGTGQYSSMFSPSFLSQVSTAQLHDIFTGSYGQLGSVTDIQLVGTEGPFTSRMRFVFGGGFEVPVVLTVESASPYRISGLWLGPPVPLVSDLAEVVRSLGALPGRVSFVAARLLPKGPQMLATHEPEAPLAIGSAFKIYVLAELQRQIGENEKSWAEVVRLTEGARSLPSGVLQDWPPGSPVTIHTLASLMISMSDNTASDQLIQLLGRSRIEAVMEKTGHASASLNRPFLMTQELFKLKADSSLASAFLNGNEQSRHELLAALESVEEPTSSVIPSTSQRSASRIEWFASSADLVRALHWLQLETAGDSSSVALDILAVNPGMRIDGSRWRYVGFKGGAEPGVLALAWLLQDHKDTWYGVTAAWNLEDGQIDEAALLGILARAIDLLPSP